jgi:hypothetical protein
MTRCRRCDISSVVAANVFVMTDGGVLLGLQVASPLDER